MNDSVIQVKDLSKRYRLGLKEKKAKTFAEQLFNSLKAPIKNFKRLTSLSNFKGEDDSVFWALREVDFCVNRGELLGIIGHNGAGKSTLLKILSQITEPTAGEIIIKGKVASLLEVGTGFHPELTGRENIYMNGTILGMTRKEIDKKLDEIVDFSGVEKFLDTPVKFYSSGMKVRLGFSVAAHLDPEILIVDEVLAVGDAEFQKKCIGKMDAVAHKDGRTVLFVSHNMAAIRSLCNKAILMKNGRIEMTGNTDLVASRYLKGNDEMDGLFEINAASSNERVIMRTAVFKNQNGKVTNDFEIGDDLMIELHYHACERIQRPYFFIAIKSKFGSVCGANSLIDGHQPEIIEGDGVLRCTFKELPFLPQQYTISAGVRDCDGKTVLSGTKDIGYFNILTKVSDIGFNGFLADTLAPDSAPVLLPYSWQFEEGQIIDVNLLKYAKR